MLLDVTAVLLTSLTLAGVSGVSAAPATSPSAPSASITQEVVTRAPAGTPTAASPTTGTVSAGPSRGVDAARGPAALAAQLAPSRGNGATFAGSTARAMDASLLPRLGGRALLDQLSLLPEGSLDRFVSHHPDAISRVLADPPSADAVSDWWSLIGTDTQRSLRTAAPELVGNLDGITPSARDAANRAFLQASIATAEDDLSRLGRGERADAEQRLIMLEEIEESLIAEPGQPQRSLLSVDTAWPGRAAVVVGDLEKADYVTYMVPGMFFTVTGQMVDWTVISQDLYDEQEQWVQRLGHGDPMHADPTRAAPTRADPTRAVESIAVVSWIGYQTPGIAEVVSLDLAEDGAKFISSAVGGVQETREQDEPYVTLVTHSYGSTATLMALQGGGLTVDALVMIGSPGGSAQSVNDLGMSSDRVFVGEAAWDPVVNSAFFGSDPGSSGFGASQMSVAGGDDPVTGQTLAAASGHLGYFDAGTEAMRNVALIGLDRGDLVTGASSSASETQLAQGD